MSAEYRAPRVWHIAERFGRLYVENQHGGFSRWHTTAEAAIRQLAEYVSQGDKATCAVCHREIVNGPRWCDWTHEHGDIYCGTGSGDMALPVRV